MQSLPAVGSEVVIRQQRWRVERAFRHGPIVEIGAGGATFFVPFDHVASVMHRARPRLVRRQRWRARVAHAFASAESYELPLAALGADIEILSHQLEPWLAASSGVRRILIADDVGLGKTIEAGLIVAESIRRSDARRVLILAPATLAAQWQQELRSRFALAATIIDAESLRALTGHLPRDVNPWSLDDVYLASIDFIEQPHVLAALPVAPWDIVVIDEAHTLSGDSARHAAGQRLASRARSVVLLTATPHSGDETAARRLESLGAMDDELVVFRRTRLDIGPGPLRRVRTVRVTIAPIEARTLDLLRKFDRVARDSAADTIDATDLLLSIFNKRALSTFGALRLSIDRRLALLDSSRVRLDRSLESADAHQLPLLFGDGDEDGIAVRIGLSADRERSWLRRLRAVAIAASALETKVARLRTLISRTAEPVIVFTEFRDSLAIVERALGGVASVSVAHGGLTPRLLGDALAAFQSGKARVLVATDVASQGLNLQQRCRWVIHLDRPWNPVRLEQRAGRVDRLGQVRDVHVTELLTSHDRDFELAARVGRRAQAAATSAWLRPCDRWQRRARAAARVLHARRRLAALWRGPAEIGRPVVVRRTNSPEGAPRASVKADRQCHEQRGAPAGELVRLYRTDILDRAGRVREQVLTLGAAPMRRAQRLKRLARLNRLEGERARQRSAVARALGARHRRGLTQLNLPGTGKLQTPAQNISRAEPTEDAEAPLLYLSPARLIAFESD